MPWLFFLKASAEVESADHLYPVEDGFRKQYTDFGGETKRQQVNRSKSVGVGLRYRYRYRLQASSMSPHRSSSRAMVLLRNHAAKLLPFRHVWISCPELREGQKNLHILQFTDDRILPIRRGSKFKYIIYLLLYGGWQSLGLEICQL